MGGVERIAGRRLVQPRRKQGRSRLALALALATALPTAPGCSKDHGNVLARPTALADLLAGIDRETTLFERTVTTDPDGSTQESLYLSDNRSLTNHLGDLTSADFSDDNVAVDVEDFSDPGVSGMVVRLRPRRKETEQEIRQVVERALGKTFDEWQTERSARPHPARFSPEEVLEQEAASATDRDQADMLFLVRLAPEPATALPRRHTSPIPLTDLERLDSRLRRADAIRARGDEVYWLQEGFVRWLEEQGGEVVARHWVRNVISARMQLEVARRALEREDVVAVHANQRDEPMAVWPRDTIREKLQVQDYLDAGYDGEQTSSRNDFGIYVAIMEASDQIDEDHVGLNEDDVGNSRVFQTLDCDCPLVCGCDGILDACEGTHGIYALTAAVADFEDGQDPSLSALQRTQRSGMAPEASISVVSVEGTPVYYETLQQLMEDGVDVINYSAGTQNDCVPGAGGSYISDAFYDGILWFNSMGNQSNCGAATCNACRQAADAGTIAIGQHQSQDNSDLDSKLLCTASSDGRASWGVVADLIAPGGVHRPMNCGSGGYDADTASCGGTSFSSPYVAGAGALLIHYWIARFSDTTAHQPGRMHAVLLNMGDGCGNVSTIDGRWGTGRLRMRMYDDAGMDFPWKHRTTSVTLTAADQSEAFSLNLDANNVNQPLGADVDALSASLFCYFNNLDDPAKPDIFLDLRDVDLDEYYSAPNHLGEKAQFRTDPVAHRYELHVTVAPIDSGSVSCWLNWAWEDADRDDADGPPEVIESFPRAGHVAPACLGACP